MTVPAAPAPAPADLAGTDLACLRGERLLFRGLSFRLAPGGALLLTGPNGSGKSSLLRLLAGLLPPARGRVTWGGAPVVDDPEAQRARTHYLGHAEGLKAALTVRESLVLQARLRGRPAGDAALRAALDALDLPEVIDRPGRILSAGQKRRVALARLVLCPAPLWLLDEPSVGLDVDALAAFRAACAAHRAAGGLIVAATHADLGLDGAQRLEPAAFAPDPADPDALGDLEDVA